ncbi:MAG: hypothetical protein EB027_07735, partial [Actinobacteria bacterium]|nr:hypothetical protein [Actinomycetota bacterium]
MTRAAAAPTVTSPAASAVTLTTATLGGVVTSDGGAAVTARGVVYCAGCGTPVVGTHTTVSTNGTIGAFTVNVTGLSTNTTYTYRAYATNGSGTTYSDAGTFITYQTAVTTWAELHAMRNNLLGRYLLMNDLGPSDPGYDIYAGPSANGGLGWEPIGTVNAGTGLVSGIYGAFRGQGFTISGLRISRPTENYVGLFRAVTNGTSNGGAQVRELRLTDVNITGRNNVGAVAGMFYELGELLDVSVTGTVAGQDYVGGAAGSPAIMRQVRTAVTVSGRSSVGGLAGGSGGDIAQSFSSGTVSGTGNRVGGLIGTTAGWIVDSYSTASVSGQQSVGGLVGYIETIDLTAGLARVYSSGNVSGTAFVGGLVGSGGTGTTSAYWN